MHGKAALTAEGKQDVHRFFRREFFRGTAVGAVQNDAGVFFAKVAAQHIAIQRISAMQYADMHQEVQRAIDGRRSSVTFDFP